MTFPQFVARRPVILAIILATITGLGLAFGHLDFWSQVSLYTVIGCSITYLGDTYRRTRAAFIIPIIKSYGDRLEAEVRLSNKYQAVKTKYQIAAEAVTTFQSSPSGMTSWEIKDITTLIQARNAAAAELETLRLRELGGPARVLARHLQHVRDL